ncbi:SGNH/GDSL hydrolase family protein [Actinosynnema sp. NPDC047251]|uniref:GDSL-like lipase/acylhydrolase family protein n=1 Tax=Saccharothrix espanaensis (strain ATCC 51144 / DSM 44229 / JCM 9112 / NBRC 15066 / NRRL 15764) TaxID=1179773 RepID=K0K2E0_SACES|nr:SGNH/GDSL hydrolase family protein [Saccharothrix espanaensis]CCH30713.1 GDSL-like lipase/acylhydrolase family protein [Saccharothrix espanaensis DSM 44229]
MKKIAAVLLTAALGVVLAPTASAHPGWAATWAASPHEPTDVFGPTWGTEGFDNHTVRQVVRTSGGGPAVRVRLSNAYGSTPLKLTGATVARSAQGAAVRPETVRHLTFGGHRSTTVRPGGELVSDVAFLPVEPLQRLTVTLYFAGRTGPATGHSFATATSYRAGGDHRADASAAAFGEKSESWYYLSGVETVDRTPRRDVVVAFGDSITDGAGATVDGDNRYPDELAERLRGRKNVVNAGIGGNRVLNDSACFGEKATERFARDALGQPDVRTVILLEGINDIGFSNFPIDCALPNPVVTAADVVAGYRDLIRQAHAKGVRVVGATLLPYKGAAYHTEAGEAVRDEVNAWIRTSGEFDAVVDFEKATADPADPDSLLPAYDSGDKLHPSDAGYRAMAQAVDLSVL